MTHTIDKNIYGSLLAEFQPTIVTTEEENEQYLEIVRKVDGAIGSLSRTRRSLGSVPCPMAPCPTKLF
jgi:hypothetical protein